ncbi:MarR family winged helix-turn-helix transcriptional regulator [Pseudomonas sp. dw_358]|uniref:MarR family winged helix-turn-helix transcriptional regulator n=1 Tax=Pseudomonas sp. dw_358 TaxID=2720083 RepID=UPI001BD249A5
MTDFTAPEQLAEALRQVVGNLVRKVRGEAQTPSSAQSETLGFIDRHGPASVSELAAHRQVKHQSMRLVVAQLETRQLVSRAADPNDGRKQLLALTPAGLELLLAEQRQRRDWLATRLAQQVSSAERQTLGAAVQILEKLLAADGPSR